MPLLGAVAAWPLAERLPPATATWLLVLSSVALAGATRPAAAAVGRCRLAGRSRRRLRTGGRPRPARPARIRARRWHLLTPGRLLASGRPHPHPQAKRISTTSAVSTATSVPVPIATRASGPAP